MLLTLAVGCASEQPDVFEYDCKLVRSCNDVAHVTRFPIVGTVDEVKDFAHGWSAACQALTESDVTENRCDYVWCAALCSPVQARASGR